MSLTDDSRVRQSARRFPLQMQQPLPPATVVDRIAFLIGTFAALWLALIFLAQGFRHWYSPVLMIPIWAIIAYLALPRLHRMLSDLYVPDYFFGRTRTGDGLLGDPVNLGVDGSFAQLDHVMLDAGWHRADELNARSTWGMITSFLLRRSYPTAPVSPLFLFGRRQDVAYEQEVGNDPKQRHHVRFWHCPQGWLLPGGAHADWLGAGTYDTNVGLSLFTLQITHRIDANTDVERDFVVSGATKADPNVQVRILHDFTTGYHSRNGGGDRFITDGNLPVLELAKVETPPAPAGLDDDGHVLRPRAPLSVALGFVALLVGTTYELLTLMVAMRAETAKLAQTESTVAWSIAGLVAVAMIGQLVLAAIVLRSGGRRSRIVLLVLLTLTVIASAVSYAMGETPIAFNLTLLGATAHCLALIALSSESAAAWSKRKAAEPVTA